MLHFKGLVRAFQISLTAVLNGSKYHTISFFLYLRCMQQPEQSSFLLHPCETPCLFP